MGILTTRRSIIENAPSLKMASGSPAMFTADRVGKLKKCKVTFSPNQPGSGDPSLNNVRPIYPYPTQVVAVSPTAQIEDGTVYSVSISVGEDVYGGYLDFCTGELVALYQSITLGESISPLPNARTTGGYANSTVTGSVDSSRQIYFELGWPSGDAWQQYCCDTTIQDKDELASKIIADCYKDVARLPEGRRVYLTLGEFWVEVSTSTSADGHKLARVYFTLPSNISASNIDAKRAYLKDNPVQLVYPLLYPRKFQLTPQTIKTLVGANNIMSNGAVEVEYWSK